MKKMTVKSISIILTLVLVWSVLSVGCAKKEEVNTDKQKETNTSQEQDSVKEKNELEPVTLTWYYRTTPQKDHDMVEKEINKITKEKINATVVLKPIDGGSFNDKMRTTIASGEEFDICFTAHWANNVYNNVAKGAFLPLEELLPKYAPKTYASMPKDFWNAVTIKGSIYGVPNYQFVGKQTGMIFQESLVEKYNINLESLKTLEDLTPIFEEIKNNEPKDTVVFPLRKKGLWEYMAPMYDYEEIGTSKDPGWANSELKVINQYKSEEFESHIRLMREWFLAGYINKDAATLEDYMPLIQTGKCATMYSDIKPGGKSNRKAQFGGIDIVEKPMHEAIVYTTGISGTLQAISKTSKNPERAMMFIELLNTDKELYNLMCFGIEGTHYNKVAENRIELVEGSGYNPNSAWAYGCQFNAYLLPGQDDDVWEQTITKNNSSKAATTLGFVFDQEPVKTQLAQCQSIISEFYPGLVNGAIDIDKYLPEFIQKLETAGADEVVAEKQRQLDEWLKTK